MSKNAWTTFVLRLSQTAGLETASEWLNHPECRAAFSMVTSHQQPDPRAGAPRPGIEQ